MKSLFLIIISLIIGFTAGHIVAVQNQKIPLPLHVDSAESPTNIKNSELKQANDKINNLQSINQSLSKQIEQMNLPVPKTTTYHEILEKIDALPQSFINKQLTQLFDEEYIDQIQDTHKFSKDLLEIALTDDNIENSSGLVNVTFSHSPITGVRLIGQALETEPFDVIYAHLAPNVKLKNCIIKWRYIDTGNILLFKQMSLDPDIQTQHVWMKPSSGWKPGSYQVTVHDLANNKQLVGSHTFQITNIIAKDNNKTTKSPDLDVINDLILNGQAISKSE